MKTLKQILCVILVLTTLFLLPMPTAFAAEPGYLPDGCYTLTSGLSNSKCLDVSGARIDNGTNIQVWSANDSVAQMFYITRESSGWYSIRNIESRKAVDVAGGVSESGVNVQLYDWNGTDAQLWQFYDAGNGYYYIKNKLGYYLDVCGGQTGDGTNVQVYKGNATNAQMWKLELADLTPSLLKTILVNFQTDSVLFDGQHPISRLDFYYKNFNHKAKYDIKRKDCWNNLFTDVAYPGFKGVILFNEWIITPEQLGNILYGLAGRLLGFSDKTIYQGGGFAASGSKYLDDASKYYGDSAIDHEFISIGIGLSSKDPTIDLDLGEVPSWVLDLAKSIL